ncbi:unnamed protein product [Didymodactylos carnosus]|uniref:Plasmid recombination enzyme n=1 Tax=Didymodactylos carnosus TaxID=1234261 RepID=A0A8S2F7U4_9BILA|nr:unnamed protein product [Didymodactylos carnosus]CAF4189430.1 unnamed protein product [Didymodactylos carnosus]
MSFAILRTAKLKSMGEIGGSLSHNYRDRPTLNANPQQTPNNEHSLKNAELVMSAIKDKLPEKRRKDAVLCVEYLITASPDWVGWNKSDEQKYFDDAKKWLEDKHGRDNVIATTIHRDESTPHMIAYVVPLVDGKLNAKKFLGGRQKLSDMQTDFAKSVGEPLGLVRGLEGSKAEHQTIKQYYSNINTAVKISPDIVLDVPEKRLLESKENYENRVFEVLDQAVSPILNKTASLQHQLLVMTNAYKGSRDEILALQGATKTYRDAVKGLKEEDKKFLDRAIVATSNDFLRKYEFERQLEYSRFMAKRDQEKEQKKQAREEQERQKRLERIAKEEQKLQKQEQPKPQKEEQPLPPTPKVEERATPQIQEQSPKPTNTRGVRP